MSIQMVQLGKSIKHNILFVCTMYVIMIHFVEWTDSSLVFLFSL